MYAVTTAQKTELYYKEWARRVSAQLCIPYVERRKMSLPMLKERYGLESLLLIGKEGPRIFTHGTKSHGFHLSMGELRIQHIDKGADDHLVEALGKESVESLLDCTLGLGADSIVMNYALPHLQRHIGLEGNPLLAYVTNWGLRHFTHHSAKVIDALRRIQVVHMTYEAYFDYLEQTMKEKEKKPFDVIYFDPMFTDPIMESPQFQSLRSIVLHAPLDVAALRRAQHLGRRVIVKNRPHYELFKKAHPQEWFGGKYSKIGYAVYYGI